MEQQHDAYENKYEEGDILVLRDQSKIEEVLKTDLPETDLWGGKLYWIPSEKDLSYLRDKELIVISVYFWHNGYPIYILNNSLELFERFRIYEGFLNGTAKEPNGLLMKLNLTGISRSPGFRRHC